MSGVTNYSTGRRYEYLIRNDLEYNGYQCIRAAGSKGVADIIALKPNEVLLVQVKNTNPQLTPNDRAALLNLARITGALPLVAHKPLRKPIMYRQLTGPGPKDWQPWTADTVGAVT